MQPPYYELLIDADQGEQVAMREYRANGAPIVLLHGVGLNLALWDQAANLLAWRYQLVSIDLFGHGASDTPASFSIERDLRAVETVVAELGLLRPVVSHS
jgi:(E)-2-((N-methylformamido)methylene)succinate hydrolase